jgi:hypothetical protein
MTDIADDPRSLAAYVKHLGGEPVEHRNFRFRIALSQAKAVIPEINRLGLSCTKVGERTGTDLNGRTCSIATIEISRKPESDYQTEKDLMSLLVR